MEKDSPPRFNRLVFHQVDRQLWEDLERLFESRGGPKHCWCMVWRTMPRGVGRSDRRAKRGAMQRRVAEGVPVGILGYRDREPVAWCSIAPRDSYRHLGGENGRADETGQIWSLGCFFVQRRLRGHGVTRRLIRAAVDHARAQGATIVEAYPVDPDSPSYRFMGYVSSFEASGVSPRREGWHPTARHAAAAVAAPKFSEPGPRRRESRQGSTRPRRRGRGRGLAAGSARSRFRYPEGLRRSTRPWRRAPPMLPGTTPGAPR